MEEIDIYFIDETMAALWCCVFNVRMPLIVSRFAISLSKITQKSLVCIVFLLLLLGQDIIEKIKWMKYKDKFAKRILSSTFCEKCTRMLNELPKFQKPKNFSGLRWKFLKRLTV